MSNLFTKVGGYIVSGDPLVYSNNDTMTGDGTVNNPFGVRSTDLVVNSPLFTGYSGTSAFIGYNNETVLWSAATPVAGGSVITTEPMTSFDKIDLYFSNISLNGYSTVDTIYVVPGVTSFNLCHAAGASNAWIQIAYMTITGNYDTIQFEKQKNFNFGSFASETWPTPTATTGIGDSFCINKIVGINRKS